MKLKREVVLLKREMNATSSQDEFAKWAKLRRRHDKTLEEYEAKSTFISTKNLYSGKRKRRISYPTHGDRVAEKANDTV